MIEDIYIYLYVLHNQKDATITCSKHQKQDFRQSGSLKTFNCCNFLSISTKIHKNNPLMYSYIDIPF